MAYAREGQGKSVQGGARGIAKREIFGVRTAWMTPL